MTPLALLLVLCSAALHALWNLLGKRVSPGYAFFWLANLTQCLVLLPFGLWMLGREQGLAFWGWLLASGLCQNLYMAALAAAYRQGDLSLAYPLARALPMLLVGLGGLALGQVITPAAGVGMALMLAGCLLLPVLSLRQWRVRQYLTPGCALALLAAVGTSGYSLIDAHAISLLRVWLDGLHGRQSLVLYYLWLQVMAVLVTSLPLLWWPRFRTGLMQTGRRSAGPAMLAGIMMGLTYSLVLWSLALASQVSYVVALRQLSIPLGVLLGIWLLGESYRGGKLPGAALILGGLTLVALAG
ncbi:EamA family transporter [Oceanimonas doudoroffii]|uniref:EamA domain-containing protein n=1 Tax=Oceanimonas doudoroffii TaxID=84158 RepID=A0A233RDD0_9GAMM|nr:EamA family transporter [Oceanimonas doudoroffii]OXY81372.1 hypothetical protein B6S08_12855 [Oceanimonas doudoroffii]